MHGHQGVNELQAVLQRGAAAKYQHMERAVDSPLRPRAGRHRRFPHPAYAAIDLGTHNCRMLIARPDGAQGFRVVQGFSRPVRLGEGLASNRRLADAAVDRAIGALAVCARRISRAGVRRVRAVATAACRRADNVAAFLARVRRETGLVLEPVSAAAEAELTLVGCLPLLDRRSPYVLMFDIGGGSTEVSWIAQRPGERPEILGLSSLPFGVVTFAERYGGDVVSGDAFRDMVRTTGAALAPLDKAHRIGEAIAAGQMQMLGTSGTVTTLAAAHLGLRRYDRRRVDGLEMRFADIAAVSARLAAGSWVERAANPCIGPERADLVVAGCAILEAICRRWPVGRLKIADRGLREGLLLSMMSEDQAGAATAADFR